MTEQKAPTLLDFVNRARHAVEMRPEPATSGEVMMALVSVLTLYEAMRKITELMIRDDISRKDTPEMEEIRNLLERTFRTSAQGVSDVLDRLAGEHRA